MVHTSVVSGTLLCPVFLLFLSDSILIVHHSLQPSPNTVAPAATLVNVSDGSSGYFFALNSSSFTHTLENISNLCSAGRHLIRRAHRLIPAHISETYIRCGAALCVLPKAFQSWQSTCSFASFCLDARWGVLVCPWSVL